MPKGGIRPICSVANCEKPHRANGLCSMHESRLQRHGAIGSTHASRVASGGPCTAGGCSKTATKQNFCDAHYVRQRRHGGDPLAGGTPFGDPMRFFLNIVVPYTEEDCLIWPYTRNNEGRGKLRIDDKMEYVHRLMCQKLNGPPPTPRHEAAHSCGKGHEGCVTGRHLSWKTHFDNMADRVTHGTLPMGERVYMSKVTEKIVAQIREMSGFVKQKDIGKQFGLTQSSISRIILRKTWKFIP